jgi:hypothetical protein
VGAVDKFKALADAGENDGVFADDASGADERRAISFLPRSPTIRPHRARQRFV